MKIHNYAPLDLHSQAPTLCFRPWSTCVYVYCILVSLCIFWSLYIFKYVYLFFLLVLMYVCVCLCGHVCRLAVS